MNTLDLNEAASFLNPYLAHFHEFRLLHDNNLLI
jgi:hypothetical protein